MRRAAACGVLLLGAGCATLPGTGVIGDGPARATERQALDDWSLTGRVAIAAAGEGYSGGIAWRQQGTRADIELRGPLGGTAIRIRVDGDSFSVTDGSGTVTEGEAARRIVDGQIGATLPVAELRYWLVGAPAPGMPHRESADPAGRLETLEQAGWKVRYLRYADPAPGALPARIEATTEGLRLRLSVAEWRLAP